MKGVVSSLLTGILLISGLCGNINNVELSNENAVDGVGVYVFSSYIGTTTDGYSDLEDAFMNRIIENMFQGAYAEILPNGDAFVLITSTGNATYLAVDEMESYGVTYEFDGDFMYWNTLEEGTIIFKIATDDETAIYNHVVQNYR